jgi:hypothetical protein
MESLKRRSRKDESTDAEYRDGTASSSDEAFERKQSKGAVLSSFVNESTIMGGTDGQNKAV